ncbi:MAG: helix-turn-helix domain-containing protein [Anaerolineaceae bacterium]|nr:helix-turn-helix domain-containing protein [Anaerolineaceae bacterium]
MDLKADERPSDSPLVERVWSSRSEQSGEFISIAVNYSQLVITKRRGTLRITMRGPETKASRAYSPDDADFVGILFKLGTFMPNLPTLTLVDCDIDLPQAASQSFWLNGSAWEVPTFENADTFVERLIREGLLVHDPIVDSVLQDEPNDLSLRTTQRRFLQATGLTHTTVRQIERARQATMLLKQGTSILDTVFEAGYFDQPHLTRSLKQYVGQTPAQIIDKGREERLSFLYNTDPLE